MQQPTSQKQSESTIIDSPIQAIWEKVKSLQLEKLFHKKIHSTEYLKGSSGQLESQVQFTYKNKSQETFQIQEISEQDNQITFETLKQSQEIEQITHQISLKEITDTENTFLKWDTYFSQDVKSEQIELQKQQKLDYFQDLKKRKILFVMTSNDLIPKLNSQTGYYYPEVAIVYEYLKEKGYDMVLASPKGGKAPCDERSVLKFQDNEICQKWTQNQETQKLFSQTIQAKEVNVDEIQAVFYPGGKGPMFDLYGDEDFHEIAKKIYENKGIIAALCHGPAAILNVKLSDGEYLVKGKKCTCFSNLEDTMAEFMPFSLETTLRERGGDYEQKDKFQSFVLVDSRVITGQNPSSTEEFAETLHKEIQNME